MTLEEHIEMHRQWLESIESNLSQVTSDLAAMGRRQVEFQDNLNRIAEEQARFAETQTLLLQSHLILTQNQAQFSANLNALSSRVDQLTERVDKLAETVDRFIRAQGDGRRSN